jgi:hypothetical protein
MHAMRIALLVVLASARVAYAGLDCDEAVSIKSIEAFAKSKKSPPGEYEWICLQWVSPKLAPRIEAACTKILDRDGIAANPCVIVSANAGFAKLGTHDIFAAVVALPEDPVESTGGVTLRKTHLLGNMGDARGAPVIREMWTTAQPRADAREKKKRSMSEWSSWRQSAARSLGLIGGPDDVAFLEAQIKATKDKHVARECKNAIAAIQKRNP